MQLRSCIPWHLIYSSHAPGFEVLAGVSPGLCGSYYDSSPDYCVDADPYSTVSRQDKKRRKPSLHNAASVNYATPEKSSKGFNIGAPFRL